MWYAGFCDEMDADGLLQTAHPDMTWRGVISIYYAGKVASVFGFYHRCGYSFV